MVQANKLSAAETVAPKLRLSSFLELQELITRAGVRLIALDVRGTLLTVPREGNLTRSLAGLVPPALLEDADRLVPPIVLARYGQEFSVRDWTLVTLLECCDMLRSHGVELNAVDTELAVQRLADEYRLHSVPLVDDERLAFALAELRLGGVRTVAAADGPQAREQATLKTQLPHTYSALHDVFSSETAGVNKLSSDYFERLLKREGLCPSQLLVIGDRIDKDITPAKTIGAHCLLVKEPSQEDCWWSDGLNGLLPALPRLLDLGVVLGRFQPFHVEHMRYIRVAAARAKRLIVGITRPYGAEVGEPGDERNADESNPVPLWLRRDFISAALNAAGLGQRVEVIPLPLSSDALRVALPPTVTVLTTAVEPWSIVKERTIREGGLCVERLDVGLKTISATMLRSMIRSGDKGWRQWLPPGIPEHLISEIERYIRNSGSSRRAE
jgi:FMN phosphatase YigB (HAD superfamily)/nicotinamide mononucleotide adenylyltransferase